MPSPSKSEGSFVPRPRSGHFKHADIHIGNACGPAGKALRFTLHKMTQARIEFTHITSLRAEAVGEPGQRTFRILVDSDTGSAMMWLEKEQLFQLGLAISQLIATLPDDEQEAAAPHPSEAVPHPAQLDFKIGKIVLGHDSSNGLFMIDAHDPDDEESATVKLWADRSQAQDFSEEALLVCASGRPLCHLCSGPLDPSGHVCARVNGHKPLDEF